MNKALLPLVKNILVLLFITISITSIAQNPQKRGGKNGKGQMPAIGQISGIVIDSSSNHAVEYATVALIKKRNNEIATGTITKRNGRFFIEKIAPGKYYLKISFLGYDDKIVNNITINKDQHIVNLKKITLNPAMVSLDEVVIDGATPRIDYRIDKKVINVSKQITAISGTAVDVLENVPSVKVDIEGNVLLRGSGGFTVLIDGRPSVLDANDALQQIPASTIDNIEIITNPSAKYDPDGTAGIINIITKKNKLQGFSGIVNLNAGLNDKYGGDVLVNYKKRSVNVYFGFDYNLRNNPGDIYNDRYTESNDTIFKTLMNGTSNRKREMWGMRTGIDFNIGQNDMLSFGARFGDREMNKTTNSNYDEWMVPGENHNIYKNNDHFKMKGYFYSLTSNYQHKFKKKGSDIKLEFSYDNRDFESSAINTLTNSFNEIVDGKKNVEDGPSSRIRAKADYTLPIGKTDKFEAGIQTRFSKREDNTKLYLLDLVNHDYIIQPEFSNLINYKRNIHALYSTYGGERGNFGYQAGLRAEYTYRNIISNNDSQTFNIDRWDIFPTLHLSYQLPKDHQVMTSYTRRIQRSRSWYLEPFVTWVDAFNVRQGNPALLPEYIDSFELGYLKKINKSNMVSVEGYYRITNNKVETVRSVYAENVMLRTPENVGKDYSLGVELMFSFKLFSWWDVDLMGDLYNYKVEGTLYNEPFSSTSNNWSSRFNNSFKIKKSTKISINSMYNGASVTAQGETAGYYMVNAAVKQDFLDKKLSAVLQVRDIFSSAKHEFTSSGPDFYNYSEYNRVSPTVMLTVSYRFNNYRPDKKSRNGDDEDMESL